MSLVDAPPPYGPVPDAFLGVWQRTLLEVNGTPAESGWQVFWLQTPHWHGDIRVPPGRPDFAGCSRLSDCSPAQQTWLAGQKGFAGITEITHAAGATYCQWHRQFDFQPPRPHRDFGRMVLRENGTLLEEFGVDTDYRETWMRVERGIGACAAGRRSGTADTALGGLLLVAGTCFFYLRDRPQPLPPGMELSAVAGQPAAVAMLDMEVSFGDWDRAAGTGMVTLSTLPWCEGRVVSGSIGQ